MGHRAGQPRRSNLPAELTSFLGRRGELREVKRLLTTTSLLTLTGSGGAGKTRLALRAAAEMFALAVVRLGSLSLDQLNHGLASELSILGSGNRGAEARQQTLEATIG
jgi:predicted ATPase